MNNLAEQRPHTRHANDLVVRARAETLRAAILSIPEDERAAVIALLSDIIPGLSQEKPKAPQRGGELLNNVFELFRKSPEIERRAADVLVELAKAGVPAEPQPVRSALNYLNSRRILKRVSYGRYLMEDGALLITHEWEGQ